MNDASATGEVASVNPMFVANMAAMSRWAPAAHAALAAIDHPHSEIVLLPDNGIDLLFRSQSFYGRDAVAHVQEQFDAFAADPLRWHFNRPDAEALKGVCGKFVERIEANLQAEKIGVQPAISGQSANFALVFGIGLGLHVEPLIAHTQARTVVLIEPMIENLYHSMFVVDWAALFEDAAEQGRQLSFVLDEGSGGIAASVRNCVRARNPAMLDGVYVYNHYGSSVLDSARDRVRREFFLNISGLGFFEDELVMLANGSANLNRPNVNIIDRQLPSRETPVFIVGSGPSIDQQLPFIKKFRDKAIVISIGTGVRVLRAHGLSPDFHVELENGFSTAYVINLVRKEFGLDGITLIAPITVRTEVVDAFDDALLFFREKVTSTVLYKEQHCELSPSGPTVANSALIVAIRFGFRNITLFGLDMGTRDEAVYHSLESIYAKGVLAEITPASSSSPANFGGTAFADSIFTWSRQILEAALKAYSHIDCCNCSDGALIEGAVPTLPEMLSFDGESLAHDVIKQEIRAGMAQFTKERRETVWTAAGLWEQTLAKVEQGAAILDRAANENDPALDWAQEIYDLVSPDDAADDGVLRTLFRGSVVLMLGCANWYGLRLEDTRQGLVYRRLALGQMRTAFQEMADRTHELLGDIEAFCDGQRDDIPVIDWSLLVRPELAGKLIQA